MNQHIAHIALVVDNYDEAIQFYTQKLNFTLIEDTKLGETKRWVKVAPKGDAQYPADGQCCLLLAQAPMKNKKAG
jgi:catechol 2,3-dioxygenase-like lactoylglutathione lyase family enzyme